MAAVPPTDDYSDPPSPNFRSGHEQSRLLPAQSDTHAHPPTAFNIPSAPLSRGPSSRAVSTSSFVSSPLNPSSPPQVTNPFARSRPASRSSYLDQHMRDTTHSSVLNPSMPSTPIGSSLSNRGSMILYKLASEDDAKDDLLVPPKFPSGMNRDSAISSSRSSFISLDSKYPLSHRDSAFPTSPRGLVPYAYDPALDELEPVDDEDLLHDPSAKSASRTHSFPWRGLLNVAVMLLIVAGLLLLFIFYPVLSFFSNEARNNNIDGNIRINGTGQAPVLFQMPDVIDPETPQDVRTRTGFDGKEYNLVFSDEFNTPGRTFYPGDDPFWEAVDLWYGATADLEWYDPQQITTRDGALVITMDSATTTVPNLTPGSTAPFTPDQNHNLNYRSGMLQSWNKFCFTSGYIEVGVILPGPDDNTKGYWPGAWTMGNLARPGYPATTDGMWPYTYNSCDLGTFPNQTNKDKLGPPAALHSDASRAKYNYELSWLSGQRLSACSCPGGDHPGPTYNKGRGAPEIDIFEAEQDKETQVGQVASQSAQFAPFTHDYLYGNTTADQFVIYDTTTRPNSYRGSAVQQAVSSLAKLPADMFQGVPNKKFRNMGFEYWANPTNIKEGYITWQVDGKKTYRVGATAVGPDQGPDGSGVGQRLIPEEPMSIVLNLGISQNWQSIDLSTMIFPAELLIDYVRVYQRKDSMNIGCDPKDYPTANYIATHLEAYQNMNLTTWPWEKPKNSLYDGC